MPATVPAVRLRSASTTARALRLPHCSFSVTSSFKAMSFGDSASRMATAGKVPSDEDRRKAARSVEFSAMVDRLATRLYSAQETGMAAGVKAGVCCGCRGAMAVRNWMAAASAVEMWRNETRRRSTNEMMELKGVVRAIVTVFSHPFFDLFSSFVCLYLLFYVLFSFFLFLLSYGFGPNLATMTGGMGKSNVGCNDTKNNKRGCGRPRRIETRT